MQYAIESFDMIKYSKTVGEFELVVTGHHVNFVDSSEIPTTWHKSRIKRNQFSGTSVVWEDDHDVRGVFERLQTEEDVKQWIRQR